MTSLKGQVLVLDACALINLAATGKTDVVRLALECEFHVARKAFDEAEVDPVTGRRHAKHLQPLVDAAVLKVADLDEATEELFVDVASTVGDGEAATIAYGLTRGALMVTDDGPAIEAWRRRTSTVALSTAGLLRCREVEVALGLDGLRACVMLALTVGRMRVLPNEEPWLENLLPPAQLVACPSLRFAVRERARQRVRLAENLGQGEMF